MKIRKCIALLITLQFTLLCYSQTQGQSQDVKRVSGKAYLMSDGIQYEIREDVVLARLKDGKQQVKDGINVQTSHSFGMLEIMVPNGVAVEEYKKILDKTCDFEYVDYDTYSKPCMCPNDSDYSYQWGPAYIQADAAWEITTGSPSVKVAIIDPDGFDLNHPDLYYGNDTYSNLSVSEGVDYVSSTDHTPTSPHGTMIAGIIAAKTNNGIGVAGIAGGNNCGGSKIIPYRAATKSQDIAAIYDAVSKGAKIITIGFTNAGNTEFDQALAYAYNHGVSIVCATGNDNLSSIPYPASNEHTIAVGAVDQASTRASFSNYGTGLDFVAPGAFVRSTIPYSSNYGYYSADSGTSLAAPHVSGVIALMLSIKPYLTPYVIKSILIDTAKKINTSVYSYDSNGWNEEVGYGLVNALNAVLTVVYPEITGPQLISTSQSYSVNGLPNAFSVEWSLSNSFYNQNCLQQNYPSTNQCTITRSSSQDMMDATLTATIKYNGETVRTITKTGLYAYSGFKGQYVSGNYSGNINYTHFFTVKTNVYTYVTSPNFYGATVSYDPDGAIPTFWEFNNQYGDLRFIMPTSHNNYPVAIDVYDVCGNYYQLYAMPDYYYLNISTDDQSVFVTLNKSGDSSESWGIDQPWTIEIRSALTGNLKATKLETSRSASVSTAGWPKGVYVIKATVGDEVITEKITVK